MLNNVKGPMWRIFTLENSENTKNYSSNLVTDWVKFVPFFLVYWLIDLIILLFYLFIFLKLFKSNLF